MLIRCFRNQTSSLPLDTASDLVLNNLSLSIPPSQRVALCGRTGSGKSSLLALLLRLLDPSQPNLAATLSTSLDSGVELGSLPLHRISRSALRRRIIAVPQDAVFFPAGSSIRENFDPYGEATDLEIKEVLELVGLSGFLEKQGGRLSMGMSAENLSAGQKQLFSLGRAILQRRVKHRRVRGNDLGGNNESRGQSASTQEESRTGGILLLDEVNSSVDRETENLMIRIIGNEFRGYTILMVSHRLDVVVEFADRVIVLDAGRMVEDGDPRKLIEEKSGIFRELWLMEVRNRG